MKRKSWIGLVVSAAVLTAGWLWWQSTPAEPKPAAGTATIRVSKRDVVSQVLAPGKVLAQVGAEVNVGARISGKLERLLVGVGDRVSKGQIIAEIEKGDLLALVRQREAEAAYIQAKIKAQERQGPQRISLAQAEWEDSLARRKFAQSVAKRLRDLSGQDMVARQDYEEASKELKVTQAQVEVARQKLDLARSDHEESLCQLRAEREKAKASLRQAEVNLSYATIRAPLSGVVASVSTRQGETVAAGMSAPTFVTIIDPDRLQVDAYVDEVDIGRVKVGQKAVFSVDAFADREFQGKVSAILPRAVVNDNVVSYDCIISITTPSQGLLRPEMNANVILFEEERKGLIVVPATCLSRATRGYMAYKMVEGKPQAVPVELGWRGEEMVEIKQGLRPGDVVLAMPPARGVGE